MSSAAAQAFDPAVEAVNYSKVDERRRYDYSSPAFQAKLREEEVQSEAELAQIRATDPERNPDTICASRRFACAGDVRYYDFPESPDGLVRDILFTNRNGATLPGRVWATKSGPAKRPAVVLTSGGLAPDTLYWFGAVNLAKAGYVVLTFDVQGQGRADIRGVPPDHQEIVPFDRTGASHVDGTEEALEFLLSTPTDRYEPPKSCLSGTSHDDKEVRRVAQGLNSGHNPLWRLIDRDRIGLVGHSMGAFAVSFVGQRDKRVDSMVAWDNLRAPSQVTQPCASAPQTRTPVPITKPALGLSADYGQPAEPNRSRPDREAKNAAFAAYRRAGFDSGQVNIRGGTHYEFSYLPSPEWPASLRGIDVVIWYTTAWLDKYVKGDASADTRLLTDRWRKDARGAEIDPTGDGNLYSFYLRSPLDIGLAGGGRARCDDLRRGCDVLGSRGARGSRCLSRRSPIGRRNIGRIRLGRTRRRLLRLPVKPIRRTRHSYRYCVKGSRGRVSAVFSRRGRVVLAATTARGHGNRGVRPGRRARALRAYPRRRSLGRGLFRASRRSPRLVGVRRGRVRFVAVVSTRTAAKRPVLRRYLRRAGL